MVGDGGGIFVLSVNADSTAERMGLKRGDEVGTHCLVKHSLTFITVL